MTEPTVNRDQTPAESAKGQLFINMGDRPGGGEAPGGERMTWIPPTDDDPNLGNVFLAQVQQADTADTLRRLKAFTEEPTTQAAGGKAAASAAKPQGAKPQDAEPPPDTRPMLQRVLEGAGAMAKDVGKGLYQAPLQIAGGAADAVKELATASSNLADWMNSNVVDLRIAVPSTGSDRLDKWIDNPANLVRDLMPEIGKADTATGHLVRDTAQFVTGMYLGARALGAFGVEMGGTAKAMTTGAFADFATRDPDSGRLSDLLAAHPSLQNPVTSFLKSDHEDAEAVKRFKNALEGLGMGALTMGMIESVKVVRARMLAKGGKKQLAEFQKDPLTEARAQYGEIAPADIGLGNPNVPLVTTVKLDTTDKLVRGAKARAAVKATETGVPDDVVAKAIAGRAQVGQVDGKGVYVNYSRIDTPDDVKSVIDQVAEAFKGKITDAARDVQTNVETKALADAMGLTVDDVLSRRRGEPWSAEKTLAARTLMNTTAQRLVEAAQKAAGPAATTADQFAFRKLLAVHTAVQTEVIAARTETARALQAWRIPSELGGVEMSRHVQGIMEGQGGEATKEMAAALARLASTNPTEAGLNAFIQTLGLGKGFEALKSAWIAGLLSNPKTHIVNASSNTLTLMNQVYERQAGRAMGVLLRGESEIAPDEALSMLYGIKESMGDAYKAAAKAIATGESSVAWGTKFEDTVQRARPISAEAFNLGDDAMGRTVDFLGKVFDVPGRARGASDDFFKTIGYRAELHAQAVRTAFAEGLTGEAAAARIEQILLHPPENIRMAAQDGAVYTTFTNRTGAIGQALIAMRSKVPPTAIVMPFVKTPVNISRYAFERSPLAPLVGQWRADMAAGGARADLAMARMATGTTIMMVALDLAEQGHISGSGVHAKGEQGKKDVDKRLGWQPYSVRIGDEWHSYNRLDPFGMTLGLAADFADMVKRADLEGDKMDEVEEVLAAGIAAISNATVSKTYLSGLAQFFGMMSDPTQNSKAYLGRLGGSVVPAGVNALTTALDPTQRETMRMMDYVQARLPGLSQSLPARLDLWGQPDTERGGTNLVNPAQSREIKAEPIDTEMKRLNIGVDRIKQKVDWDGVPINFADWPQVYTAYQQLAGNDLHHPAWGMGAKDYLDAVVSGKHPMSQVYQIASDGPEGGKAAFIKKAVEDYRKLARTAIMADPRFQDFAELVRSAVDQKRAARMPTWK